VSSTGRPYPVEIDHLSGTGTVTLSNWDAGTLPTAPTNFVTVPS
jgi:hypothetical protein